MRLAPGGDALVVYANDLFGERAVIYFVPPVTVDADGLHVDAAAVHFPDALVAHRTPAALVGPFGAGQNAADRRNRHVGVNIDDADALAADLHDLARHRAGRRSHIRELPDPGII